MRRRVACGPVCRERGGLQALGLAQGRRARVFGPREVAALRRGTRKLAGFSQVADKRNKPSLGGRLLDGSQSFATVCSSEI